MSTTILEALQELETSKTIGKYTQKSLKERNTAYLNESLKRARVRKVSESATKRAPVNESLRRNRVTNEQAGPAKKEAIIADLWEQVYCSLTDGGVNAIYQALGDLNGKNKYGIHSVKSRYDENDPDGSIITVKSRDLDWARYIAKVYGLKSKEGKKITWLYK